MIKQCIRTCLFQVNERFNVTLRADPCKFSAYDLNRDGVITKFEFQTIFGSDENTRNLFNALDMTTGGFGSYIFYLVLIFKKGLFIDFHFNIYGIKWFCTLDGKADFDMKRLSSKLYPLIVFLII